MDMHISQQNAQRKLTHESSLEQGHSHHCSSQSLSQRNEKFSQKIPKLSLQQVGDSGARARTHALGKSVQVTFLNKVVLITLWKQENSQAVECESKISEVEPEQEPTFEMQRFLELAIKHFKIKMDFIESAHLVDTDKRQIVWSDAELKADQAYYLCFARRGFKITKESIKQARHQDIVLLDLEYFGRHGREYRILETMEFEEGKVQDLYINQSRGNFYGFYCPFLHCAKQFRKSCDLVLHFNIETGNKPYVCQECGAQFRRSSAHRRHVATCINANSKASPDLLESLKPSELEREVKAKHEAQLVNRPKPLELSRQNVPNHSSSFIDLMPNVISQIFKNQARLHEVLLMPLTNQKHYEELQLDMCRQIIKTAYFLRKYKALF